MQIWKSPYMFVFILKQYAENFAFWILRIFELFTCEVCEFLKSRLIFNVLYCFWMFINKLFTYLTCSYLKRVKGVLKWNLEHTIFIWSQRYWQIFRSALVYFWANKATINWFSIMCKCGRVPSYSVWRRIGIRIFLLLLVKIWLHSYTFLRFFSWKMSLYIFFFMSYRLETS